MPACVRCQKDVGFFGSVTAFNKQTNRCGKCDKDVTAALERFKAAFLNYCSDGILTDNEWMSLMSGAARDSLNRQEMLAYIRSDAVKLLERTLTIISADGIITDDEEKQLQRLISMLEIPQQWTHSVKQRLSYLKQISNIKKGVVPTIRPSIRLETDEFCHLETPATFHKVNTKTVSLVQGRLIATSKKLHFLSPAGGNEIAWKSVMRTALQQGGIYIELSKKTGNGLYTVPDPYMAEAVIDTLVRKAKYEVLAPNSEGNNSRVIPHQVRVSVWQRDQGKCVQCSSNSYLEYDHVIPFSKGGANTERNVQLLCRKCNLQKSDRI